MTEEQLAALLRLKRFEQPPPGYYDRLLEDIHRRQRVELLRRPLWRIALERVQAFFSERHLGDLSQAGALATALALAAGTMAVLTPGLFHQGSDTGRVPSTPSPLSSNSLFTLQTSDSKPLPAFDFEQSPLTSSSRSDAAPRYIIDSRPVSYEPSFSF